MIVVNRRHLLRVAAATALLPALASQAAGVRTAASFVPPYGPMRYTRTLRRELTKGAAFVVSRSFAVQFAPVGPGFRVEGQQVAVSVDAPSALARFAQLERERQELGLFPLQLDANGVISGAPAAIDTAGLDVAVATATRGFDAIAFAPGERVELDRFVSALHQNAASLVTALPRDLFAPAAPEIATTRGVELAGGAQGEVTVRFTALTDPVTGIMKQAMREVVTDLSGDKRRTVEEWSLNAL